MHSTRVECTDFIGEHGLEREGLARVGGKLRTVAADRETWLNAWLVGTMACRIGILA